MRLTRGAFPKVFCTITRHNRAHSIEVIRIHGMDESGVRFPVSPRENKVSEWAHEKGACAPFVGIEPPERCRKASEVCPAALSRIGAKRTIVLSDRQDHSL